MSIYLQVKDDDIKKYYKYSLDSRSKDIDFINTNFHVLFFFRTSELNILSKFYEFEAKLKHSKGENKSKNEYKKIYDKLVLEYNNIIAKEEEIWKFNNDLIRDLECRRKEISDKIGINGFVNLNKEILDNEIDSYVKFDKDLINIKKKINDLINYLII